MINVALVGLLAGSLALGGPNGDDDKKKSDAPAAPAQEEVAGPSIFSQAADVNAPRSITQDTYAYGFPAASAPIKLFVEYGYGNAENIWRSNGDDQPVTIGNSTGEIVSQRIGVGAQLNVINLTNFKVGVGGRLNVAQNKFNVANTGTLGIGDLESDFGLQGAKVYASARGRVLGVHAGYAADLGSEREYLAPNPNLGGLSIPTSLSNSDGRDAIFFGADFDYPSERVRLFGGFDYYDISAGGQNNPNTAADESAIDGDDIMNFVMGAGFKFSVFEVGAAFQLQTRLAQPVVGDVGTSAGFGGSAGTVAPYLRISPPSLPASIFIKGAVSDEYTEFGYRIGGSNSIQPNLGFTAGLAIGFD
jgi:hypothetical protein